MHRSNPQGYRRPGSSADVIFSSSRRQRRQAWNMGGSSSTRWHARSSAPPTSTSTQTFYSTLRRTRTPSAFASKPASIRRPYARRPPEAKGWAGRRSTQRPTSPSFSEATDLKTYRVTYWVTRHLIYHKVLASRQQGQGHTFIQINDLRQLSWTHVHNNFAILSKMVEWVAHQEVERILTCKLSGDFAL